MITVTKSDTLHSPQENESRYSYDNPPLYQERRQKDMGADNPHYHWDLMEAWMVSNRTTDALTLCALWGPVRYYSIRPPSRGLESDAYSGRLPCFLESAALPIIRRPTCFRTLRYFLRPIRVLPRCFCRWKGIESEINRPGLPDRT